MATSTFYQSHTYIPESNQEHAGYVLTPLTGEQFGAIKTFSISDVEFRCGSAYRRLYFSKVKSDGWSDPVDRLIITAPRPNMLREITPVMTPYTGANKATDDRMTFLWPLSSMHEGWKENIGGAFAPSAKVNLKALCAFEHTPYESLVFWSPLIVYDPRGEISSLTEQIPVNSRQVHTIRTAIFDHAVKSGLKAEIAAEYSEKLLRDVLYLIKEGEPVDQIVPDEVKMFLFEEQIVKQTVDADLKRRIIKVSYDIRNTFSSLFKKEAKKEEEKDENVLGKSLEEYQFVSTNPREFGMSCKIHIDYIV